MLARLLPLGLVVLGLGMVAPPLSAQSVTEQQLAEADRLYRGDKLFEAEAIYKKLLGSAAADIVRRSYDQLLAIYTQLNRPDQTIETANRFRVWLRSKKESLRESELDLEIGSAYFYLGHLPTARTRLEIALRASQSRNFDPLKRFTALSVLAQIGERNREPDQADKYWKQLGAETEAFLNRPRGEIKPPDKIRATWRQAESRVALRRPERAVEDLTKLLPVHDELRDPANKRETLRRLAEANEAAKRYSFAAKNLTDALELHEQFDPKDRLTRGLYHKQLMRVARLRGNDDEAKRYQDLATDDLQYVIRTPGSGQKEVAGSVAAFWELEDLYQSRKQFRQALKVSEQQAAEWLDGSLILPRLFLQQGGLQTILGSHREARDRLIDSLKDLERQQPVNLIELPRTYNNLALVELTLEESKKAEEYARKSLKLYSQYSLPNDLTIVEAHNILGNSLAQQGSYKEGIDSFEAGEKICERLGDIAKSQRSNLLLNIAILEKSQGKIDDALKTFIEAQTVYQSLPNPDELVLGAYDASLASIYASRAKEGDLTRAALLGHRLQDLCERREMDRGPLVVAWKHALALEALAHAQQSLALRDDAAADLGFRRAYEIWDDLRQLQLKEKQALLLPRTLNYLGICREMQGRDDDALKLFAEASRRQANNPRSFPQTNFITHWRTARVYNRRSKPQDAMRELAEAIDIVEKTRLQTYGAGEDRAQFFKQFETAFDLYIDWAVHENQLDEAFIATCRGRSRSLFDQLQLAQVDPTKGLEVSHKAELEKEKELLRKLSGLRARAQLVPAEAIDSKEAKKLLEEFDQTQQDYATNRRKILNASPVYRSLSDDQVAKTSLETIRQQILDDETILLVYHIGRENSYALLLTRQPADSSVHRLQVNAAIAESIIRPPAVALVEGSLPTTRGMKVLPRVQSEETAPERKDLGPVTLGPLTQEVATRVVDHYWEHVSVPGFGPQRGMKVITRTPDTVPTQRFDLLGDIFLPPDLRQRIARLKAKRMIVIPDGPLHKLPLESMLLEAGPKPTYVIDELPPIVYAPSAAILTILTGESEQRKRIDPKTPASLLTLSNPNYEKFGKAGKDPSKFKDALSMQLFGKLQMLEGSEREAKRIKGFFKPAVVKSLEGDTATEEGFRRSLNRQRFVHVAAHGFADERYSNRFGALLLTRPGPEVTEPPPENDGLLELDEIYTLPLQDTELAVLSACLTNVGPQQPLEAGVTLASGFLCAGARNVVASNWSVDDDATVELMDAFFQEIMKATDKYERPDYPLALQVARKKVREAHPSPYYWAPFVIIGQVK